MGKKKLSEKTLKRVMRKVAKGKRLTTKDREIIAVAVKEAKKHHKKKRK